MGIKQEVELRLKLDDSEAAQFLELIMKQSEVAENSQTDIYFDSSNTNWTLSDPVPRWLRVRETDGGAQLNLKSFEFSESGDTTRSEEIELTVSDSASAVKLLHLLGFHEVIRVSKKRISANIGNMAVSIDSVRDLGTFAEVEAIVPGDTYKSTMNEILKFVSALGIEVRAPDQRGYPYALLKKNRPNHRS